MSNVSKKRSGPNYEEANWTEREEDRIRKREREKEEEKERERDTKRRQTESEREREGDMERLRASTTFRSVSGFESLGSGA